MEGKILSGKYKILRKVAAGGMGVIYEAIHASLQRTVALKILHPRFAQDLSFIHRFEREARAMARLDHKNIIRVFDVLDEKQTHFIVMEYFPGKNIREILKEKHCLSQKAVLSIAYQIAEALGYAHAQGIIHRDIKPANILINSKGLVKIADFGIATALDETAFTGSNHIVGTPDYMSPEQARGEVLDGASDLYSLGMVMYEMSTGKTGYETCSNTAILKKLIYEPSQHELVFSKKISPHLQQLICDLLVKDKTNRVATTDALILRIKTVRTERKKRETLEAALPEHTPAKPLKIPPKSKVAPDLTSFSPKPTHPHKTMPTMPQPSRGKKPLFLLTGIALFVLLISLSAYLPMQNRTTAFTKDEIEETLGEISRLKEQLANSSAESERLRAMQRAKTDLLKAKELEKKAKAQLQTANALIAGNRVDEAQSALDTTLDLYEQTNNQLTQAIQTAQAKIIEEEKLKSNHAQAAQRRADKEIERLKNLIKNTKKVTRKQTRQQQMQVKAVFPSADRVKKPQPFTPHNPRDTTLPPPSETSVAPSEAQQLDALGATLSALIEAYENKNLHALQKLSTPSKSRIRFLKHLFKNYQKITVSITDLSVDGEEAEAVISITELKTLNGKKVLPPERWKTAKLTIHQKNGAWDKAIW